MKQELGWWFPGGESHIPGWLRAQPKPLILNGRQAYQGKKQLEVLRYTRDFFVAVDIGAHVGLWSYNLAQTFTHVYAFEPVALYRECFELNVTRPNVTLYPYGLGDQAEFVGIKILPDNTGSTHISGPGNIEVRTLDSFELEGIDLIKIDTEGYELKVLRGAEETLRRCRPTVIVEQKQDMAFSRYGLPTLGAVDYLKALGAVHRVELGGDHIMSWE